MPLDGPWKGGERRQADRRHDVASLVTDAAEIAAQRVAAYHRRRLVIQTFLAALATAAAISLPVVLVANHQRAQASLDNARYNCEQGTQRARILADFIESDAKLRDAQQHYRERGQVLQAFSKIIAPKLLRRLQARSDRLDRQTTDYWREDIVPRLERLAQVNCDAVLTSTGPSRRR